MRAAPGERAAVEPHRCIHTIADNTVDSVPHSNDDDGAHPALVLPPRSPLAPGRSSAAGPGPGSCVLATGNTPRTVRQMHGAGARPRHTGVPARAEPTPGVTASMPQCMEGNSSARTLMPHRRCMALDIWGAESRPEAERGGIRPRRLSISQSLCGVRHGSVGERVLDRDRERAVSTYI